MKTTLLSAAVAFALGMSAGCLFTAYCYQQTLLKEAEAYKVSVEAARAKEQEWRTIADEAEIKYKKDLESVKSSNDSELSRLRKQLQASGRMSSACHSSGKSDADTGETAVSAEIEKLAEFSDQCARRADELIVQVSSLQSWIKDTSK